MTRAAGAGICAFALAYLLADALHLPVLVYDPARGVVTTSRMPSGLQMRYFGDLLLASTAGLGTAALFGRLPSRIPVAVPAWTALLLVALDALYYLYRLAGF